ncbi:unnamed protein product [marine sediment metagenome]|uniref:Uncharacterized protein n=1 Tax=marine sediment metagenome TaxID=412755 RepID=X0U563_9ZZZZ
MKITSHMKQVEWDVMEEEGSTQGYQWVINEKDGVAYFLGNKYIYLMGDDDEWIRADTKTK